MNGSHQTFASRAVRSGLPPALITAGLGVGATGVVGERVKSETAPIARGVAEGIGLDAQFGPAILLFGAVVIMAVAFVLPGLFDDGR